MGLTVDAQLSSEGREGLVVEQEGVEKPTIEVLLLQLKATDRL